MDKFYTGLTINKTWYDASNPVAPFTPVSLRSGSNDEVILPTVSNGVNTTRIIGVTTSFARIGEPVGILITGQILLISVVNTAITKGSTLFVASATTIASSAAPFTNVPGICPLVHPSTGAAYTMSVALVDDVAVSLQTTGANVMYYPVGVAMESATATSGQYTLIECLLDMSPFAA